MIVERAGHSLFVRCCPPLLRQVLFSVAEGIVHDTKGAVCDRRNRGRVLPLFVNPRLIAFRVRTACKTDATGRPRFLPILKTQVRVLVPGFVSRIIPRSPGSETRLVVERQGLRRTCFRAFSAFPAEFNQTEMDWLVVSHGQIGKDLAQANRGTEFRSDQLVEAA